MNRRKILFGIVALLLVVLVVIPCCLLWKEYRQEQRNRALIVAIQCDEVPAIAQPLKAG